MNKIKDIIRRYNTGIHLLNYFALINSILLYFSLLYKVYLYQFPLALERKDRMLYRKHIDEVSTSPAQTNHCIP